MDQQTEITCGDVLDISVVAEWWAKVKPAIEANTVLCLKVADLQRVDAAGMQAMLALFETAKQRGIKLEWDEPSPALQHAAKLTGLDQLLQLG